MPRFTHCSSPSSSTKGTPATYYKFRKQVEVWGVCEGGTYLRRSKGSEKYYVLTGKVEVFSVTDQTLGSHAGALVGNKSERSKELDADYNHSFNFSAFVRVFPPQLRIEAARQQKATEAIPK
jgi:hypothetical protein